MDYIENDFHIFFFWKDIAANKKENIEKWSISSDFRVILFVDIRVIQIATVVSAAKPSSHKTITLYIVLS